MTFIQIIARSIFFDTNLLNEKKYLKIFLSVKDSSNVPLFSTDISSNLGRRKEINVHFLLKYNLLKPHLLYIGHSFPFANLINIYLKSDYKHVHEFLTVMLRIYFIIRALRFRIENIHF